MDEVPELTDRLVAALVSLAGSGGTAAGPELRESCHELVGVFLDGERQRARVDEGRRITLWEGLLTGRGHDPAFAEHAAAMLGLPPEGPYVVVVARAGIDDVGLMRGVAQRLNELGVVSAWHVRAEEVVALLALEGTQADKVLDLLREAVAAPVGVSPPVPGIAETGVGHRQARLALRTLGDQTPAAVSLDDCLPEAMLVDAPGLADRLVIGWLGPLMALPGTERRMLLDTLEQWVHTSASTQHTADAVGCHRNTVVNRLRKIERLTGRPIATPPIPVEVSLALRAVRLGFPRGVDA